MFIKRNKTNWRIILILVVGAFLVGLWVLWMSVQEEIPSQIPEIKEPEPSEMVSLETLALEKEKIPQDLNNVFLEDLKKEYEHMLPCPGEKEASLEDFEYFAGTVDLNTDGVKEIIIAPLSICDQLGAVRGASGNGPFYIYQKMNENWIGIGCIWGNIYIVKKEKTGGYHDIESLWHMSATSGVVTGYKWQKSELKYKEEYSEEISVEPDEDYWKSE